MVGPAMERGGSRGRDSILGSPILWRGSRGPLFPVLACLALGFADGARAQDASVMPAAHGEALPPAVIEGLELRPSPPLEFSRAWLAKADAVRRRRAELQAAGRLDGVAPPELARSGAALSGELRIPVIAIRYADVEPPFPVVDLANRLFGASRGDTVTLSDYWREVSGGLLKVDGVVTSWVPLRKPAGHYLARGEYGWGRFGKVPELRRQVLDLVDPSLDFSVFDNDGLDGVPNSGDDDGYVDFVAFFYATECAAGGREGGIWPHRGAMSPYETNDASASGGRIRIADYVILPAQDPRSCGPAHIGVLAHESAHGFGLPDLYDYDGSSRGIGSWGLMGTGSHASPHSPAHLAPWSKEQLGWVRVDRVRPGEPVALPPVQRTARVLRYDLEDGTGRYLLLENRAAQGSDRGLPGHGLLVWQIDPERAELGAWNGDERRPAVGLLGADPAGSLLRLDGHDQSGPFPGRASLIAVDGEYGVRVGVLELGGTMQVGILPAEPAAWSSRAIRLATPIGGAPLRRRVTVEGGPPGRVVHAGSKWLRLVTDREGITLEADPFGLRPGRYVDTLSVVVPGGALATDRLPVLLEVTRPGHPSVIATELPWSWGMAASGGDLVQASYGWDVLGLRPRPRLLRLRDGDPFPATLSRLPAEALYAPVAGPDGSTYVLGHARGRNLIYRVAADGVATLVSADAGREPAYGLAGLPDGSLVVAGFSGRLLRVTPDGDIEPWAEVGRAVYQIAADSRGAVYAALLSGQVVRLDPGSAAEFLDTGFESGKLVAVAVAPDGRVFAAERGGAGRIVEVGSGRPRVLARARGAAFFGLAADEQFLYALDLSRRELLRLPIGFPAGRTLALRSPGAPAPPR
ncbi:MAG: M6 family metalloprotease domain-containing protein [Gemmatimonadetes bacterium]|nr:M6 family metalloprotease domain-containing protein [Gemmatimonadota bacterium]